MVNFHLVRPNRGYDDRWIISPSWNVAINSRYCSKMWDFFVVLAQPWELNSVVMLAMYIPSMVNTKQLALNNLHTLMDFIMISGNLNHANLKSMLSGSTRSLDFKTRGENCLDHVYTNMRDAYRAYPRPHLATSDHISVQMIPAYIPLLKWTRLVKREISVECVQGCCHYVNLEEYTASMTV